MLYRKEIDGLRAIAVLAVILFHGHISGFSGGYVGVDIFFVISGYLITTIIITERENKTFSLADFYLRRARRILPVLFFVLFTTTIIAYIVLPPLYLYYFSQSLISVLAFLSNIYFYIKSGYFSPVSEQSPLLHTWSLAIEEQFYFILPIIILLLWHLGRKSILYLFLLLAFISLFYSQYLASNNAINENFYLIFSRIWELLAGSIVAILTLNNFFLTSCWWRKELFSFVGLALIVLSIIYFTKQTPSPSLLTLVPIVGASLLLIFCDTNTIVGKFLSYKIMVKIGLISFSLYLWHQPIFAFLKVTSLWNSTSYIFIFALSFTFIVSVVSWKYIESIYRNKEIISQKLFLVSMLFSFTVIFSMAYWFYSSKGLPKRYDASLYSDSIKTSPKRRECHANSNKYISPEKSCEYSGENITWAILGDSHAVEIGYALSERLKLKGKGIKHLSYSGCPPALKFDVKNVGCHKWMKQAVKYLESNKKIKNVVLAFRHTGYLYGSNQIITYPLIEKNEKISTHFTDEYKKHLSNGDDPKKLYWDSFVNIITTLRNSGKKIYILYPIPELPQRITTLVRPITIFSKRTRISLVETTSMEYYLKRNQYIISKLNSLEYNNNILRITPSNIYCNSQYCSATKDRKTLYFDDNHPSLYGAKLIASMIKI